MHRTESAKNDAECVKAANSAPSGEHGRTENLTLPNPRSVHEIQNPNCSRAEMHWHRQAFCWTSRKLPYKHVPPFFHISPLLASCFTSDNL